MNKNEQERTKDMRVKIYLLYYSLDERKYSIYGIHGITG